MANITITGAIKSSVKSMETLDELWKTTRNNICCSAIELVHLFKEVVDTAEVEYKTDRAEESYRTYVEAIDRECTKKQQEEMQAERLKLEEEQVELDKKKKALDMKRYGHEERFMENDLFDKISKGSGSQGTVFSCQHRTFGTVAVKQLLLYHTEEIKLAINLRPHNHVVTVFGLVYREGTDLPTGYVMENLHTSLHRVIHRKIGDTSLPSYNLGEAVVIVEKFCCGINYLHEQGIIHRDVKPSNILTSADLQVIKICDFGTSSIKEGTLTSGVGTYPYMAPEVVRFGYGAHGGVKYTNKCDVYSAAITIWELFHRRAPYGGNLWNRMNEITKEENGLRPNFDDSPLNENMKNLLRMAWHHSPEHRPDILDIPREIKMVWLKKNK